MRSYALFEAQHSETLPGTGILTRLWRNWVARRAISQLDRLDDFLLRDIGVSRGEVHQAARTPLTANAALVLEDIAWQRQNGHAPSTVSAIRGN